MASSPGFRASNLPPIAATGMQGFLQWFRREQPNLYRAVAPQIQAQFPRVFSDYNQSQVQHLRDATGRASLAGRRRMRGGMGAILAAGRIRALGGLGQNDSNSVDSSDFDYLQSPDSSLVASFATPNIETVDTGSSIPAIADTANTSGGTSTTDASAIAAIATGAAQLYTTSAQLQTAQAINNLQIQRAQAGLAPLNIGLSASGVPTITGVGLTGSAGTLLLFAGGALLLLMMMGGKKSAPTT